MSAAELRAVRALTMLVAAGAIVAAAPHSSVAQEPVAVCATVPVVGDACQKAIDILQFSAPQLGMLLVGGSATPGQYQALGRPGSFSVNVRATGARIDLPDVSELSVGIGTPVQSTIPTTREWAAGPAIDAEIGIFGGIPLGLTRVGAVDLLGSAFYIPDVETDNFSLNVDGSGFRFGGGVRVGIVQEGLAWPGVSVTYLNRGLPTLTVLAETDQGDSLQVSDLSLRSDALRLMVGKRVGFLGFMAGVGQDRYRTTARVSAQVDDFDMTFTFDPVEVEQKMTRTNFFGAVSLNFPVIRIVGEVGRVSGGSASTYNQFDSGDAARARTYMSVGLRAGI